LGISFQECANFKEQPKAFLKLGIFDSSGILQKEEENVGQLNICIWYSSLTCRLNIEIYDTKGLFDSVPSALETAFLETYLIPDPNKLTMKTISISRKGLDIITYDLQAQDLPNKSIKFIVWHRKDVYGGETVFNLNNVCRNQKDKKEEWIMLYDKQNNASS